MLKLNVLKSFTNLENFIKRYSIVFTLIVMYQGLFGGLSLKNSPSAIKDLNENRYFRLFTSFCIAFTATKDIEISMISVLLFVCLLNIVRTPEERKKAGGFFNL